MASQNDEGDLVISSAPGRRGKYLYIQKGSVMDAVARFRDEAAVDKFIAWCKASDGSRLRWSEEG